jgi:CO/xanthine dehydrogenase Mo-binding subunit
MDDHIKYEINYQSITIKASDDSIIAGKVNTTSYARLSDMLKHSPEKFVTIICENVDGTKGITIVNKEHIVWAKVEG